MEYYNNIIVDFYAETSNLFSLLIDGEYYYGTFDTHERSFTLDIDDHELYNYVMKSNETVESIVKQIESIREELRISYCDALQKIYSCSDEII